MGAHLTGLSLHTSLGLGFKTRLGLGPVGRRRRLLQYILHLLLPSNHRQGKIVGGLLLNGFSFSVCVNR